MAFKDLEKERVSLNNFFSVLGFAAFFVLTWLGELFLTGGEMAKSLLWAGLMTIVFVVLLVVLVRIKGVTSHFRAWKVVELAVLGLYVVTAVLLSRPARHFFEVNAGKAAVRAQTRADVDSVRAIFTKYENFENDAITNTRLGILNSINGTSTSDLKDFYSSMKINPRDVDNVDRYCDLQKEKLLGNKYDQYKKEHLSRLNNWEQTVKDWSLLRIPGIASEGKVAGEIVTALSDYSKKADLPVITSEGKTHNLVSRKQVFSMEVPKLGLADTLKSLPPSAKALAVIVLVAVHLLILISYFFGFRSPKQRFEINVPDDAPGVIIL